MIRIAVLLAALLLAGPLRAQCAGTDVSASFAAENPAVYAAAEAAEAAAPNARGLLWKVERAGVPPSHLFGTFHSVEPLGRVEATALSAAKRARVLMVEITEAEQAAMQAAMRADPSLILLPAPEPFAGWLTPDLAARAEERFAALGLPRAAAERMRPWLLNAMLSTPPCAAAAAARGAPILDMRIARAAEAGGAAVIGLETWREQVEALDGWPDKDQRDAIRLALAAPVSAEDQYETFRSFYAAERPMMIWELSLAMARLQAPDLVTDEMVDNVWRIVAAERNRRMAERAAAELTKGGAMIAVGALHLPGEEGLVALLRAAGYAVTRVE